MLTTKFKATNIKTVNTTQLENDMTLELNDNTVALVDNETGLVVGVYADVEQAEADVGVKIDPPHDWGVYDAFGFETAYSAQDQLKTYNALMRIQDSDHQDKGGRFPSKAVGAATIIGLVNALNKEGLLGKAKKTGAKAKTRGTGNCARIHAIADELKAAGHEVTRALVLAKAEEEGIPRATASTQYQIWRTK